MMSSSKRGGFWKRFTTMSPQARDRWAKTRSLGRRHFILVRGVCGWGGLTFIFMSTFSFFQHSGFNPAFWMSVIVGLFICPLAGYTWGAWVWRSAEKRYLGGERAGV